MNSDFERERHDPVGQVMYEVLTEERFRDYTIKTMRHGGLESLWVFREGVLRGVVQWKDMISIGEEHQIVLRFPHAINGLVYAQWVPEDGTTDEDYAVAMSHLERYYFQAYPKDRTDGLMFRGRAALVVDHELDQCTVTINDIPFVTFVCDDRKPRLIDSRSASHWGCCSHFEQLLEPDVLECMADLAQYVYDYLISTLPPHGVVIH